jgi:hypothetical protein
VTVVLRGVRQQGVMMVEVMVVVMMMMIMMMMMMMVVVRVCSQGHAHTLFIWLKPPSPSSVPPTHPNLFKKRLRF